MVRTNILVFLVSAAALVLLFVGGAIAAVVITLIDRKPSAEVEALFDQASKLED